MVLVDKSFQVCVALGSIGESTEGQIGRVGCGMALEVTDLVVPSGNLADLGLFELWLSVLDIML